MSYTNQKVTWVHYISDKGAQITYKISRSTTVGAMGNAYGDKEACSPVTIKARKQPVSDFAKGANGYQYLAKSYFYVDPYTEPNAFSISLMDTLDGETVENIYMMNDLSGKTRMIRFTTS